MAGSFRHVVDRDGTFRGTDLLDHLGDAHEALEEMYDMILYLTGGDKQKIYEAWREGHARKRIPPGNMSLPWVASFQGFWKHG
jgi:hypothetical protein